MKFSIVVVAFIIFSFIAIFIFYPRVATGKKEITFLDHTISVLLANKTAERIQGLSGINKEDLGADGMLFVFSDKAVRNFWMKDMQFDLDVVWIEDGKVVKVDQAVNAPKNGAEPDRMSSNPFKVNAVLELPAGDASRLDLYPGVQITY